MATLLDPDVVVSFAASAAPAAVPEGAPPHELARSPAAAEVGRLAASAGMFLFHHEHRVPLELPDAWGPADDADWVDGVLPEPKYGAFRHDLRIGSFHPGHRAKWTAHELCHALVGFGWRPDAPPLWVATAARLCELAPVVLWYFLDEIGLRRCPRHTGPLFRTFCADCERAASAGPDPAFELGRAEALAREAAAFLEAELAAVARTRRLGRPAPHVFGSLDLCSDGLAYGAAHGPRLRSEAFSAWFERFVPPGDPGVHASLDDLEGRVVAVLRAVAQGEPLALTGARAGWVAQDLGQRLLDVWAQTAEPCAGELLAVVDALAAGGTAAEAFAAYVELHEAWDLPEPEAVFAVGYPVDAAPHGARSVGRGLGTVVPVALAAAEDAGVDVVGRFAEADLRGRARRPLGARFARWIAEAWPGSVADLARYEAALRTARGEPELAALGADGVDELRLAEGVEVHRFGFDVVRAAEQVDSGEVSGRHDGGRLALDPAPVPREVGLAIGRDAAGELVIAEIPGGGGGDALPQGVLQGLAPLGLAAPTAWRCE